MSEKTAATIELEFSGGERLRNLISFSLQQDFTAPLDPLTFSYAERGKEKSLRAMFQPGELCNCRINNSLQATNIITDVIETGGRDGVVFNVTAESLLTIPMESDVDPKLSKEFKQDTKISEVVTEVLRPYGIFPFGAEVFVDSKEDVAARAGRAIPGGSNNATLEPLKEKAMQTKDGQKSYPFLSALVSRHGVQLRCAGDGRLLLVRPNYDSATAYNLIQGNAPIGGTRVLAAPGPSIRNTNKGQFSHYLLRGKVRDIKKKTRVTEPYSFLEVPGASLPDTAPFQNFKRQTLQATRANYRPGVAPYKPKFWRDDEASSQVRCDAKARLMHGSRAANGFVVNVAVDGIISETGRLWTFDTIARVFLGDHDINEDMWIKSTTKSESKSSGQMTRITLIPKNSLVIGAG